MAAVVLLSINVTALDILTMLDTSLFTRADMAVRAGPRFRTIHPRLAAFESCRFRIRQLARLDALFNAVLLIDIPLYVGLHAL